MLSEKNSTFTGKLQALKGRRKKNINRYPMIFQKAGITSALETACFQSADAV
jgi:hypothetical protein